MRVPSPCKKTSLFLLGLLTLIFRFPITPAPTGTDNFFYISLTKTIIESGLIFWSENFLALYGLYPGTTPLGVPILGSVICAVTGLSIFQYVFIHGFLLSIISTYGFFMMSGELSENYRSRWFATMCFSLAPRFLTFSIWRMSLRFSLIAILPFFIWLILRLMNSKYGRHPSKILILLTLMSVILPSLHRMGLLLPGFFVAFALSSLLYYWQESATNRERAGRQVLLFLAFISVYLFYLQYLDFSPYSPDDELIGVYLFSGYGVFSSLANLGVYYMLNVGPFIFVSILGIIYWVQQGRVSQSFVFSVAYISLAFFVISDLTYIPYLLTFGVLLLLVPGMEFFTDNLEDYPKRQALLFSLFTILLLSFSHYDLNYRIEAHERDEVNYTYYVRESTISASKWIGKSTDASIIACNDIKRERRLAAYSDTTAISDIPELSSGFVNISEMELERITVKEMYWQTSDHLWKWTNQNNLTANERNSLTIAAVNLAIPDLSGKSSTLSLILDPYYKNMPNHAYKIYSNNELAIYWTSEY